MEVEEYITITDLMAGQKLYINKKEYEADESGCVFLSESMIKSEKGNPMSIFEEKINEILTDLQKMHFYRMCGRSSNVVLSSVSNALDGDRVLAKKVLGIGEGCGLLSRGHNFTWKVNSKVMKERMLMLEERIGRLLNVTQEEQTGEEHRKTVLNTYGSTNQEIEVEEEVKEKVKEETVDNRVEHTLQQYKSTLPSPTEKHTPKKLQTPKKKPGLIKALGISRKTT